MSRRPTSPLSADDLPKLLNVSRETLARFAAYLALLEHWNKRINLVGPATLADPWRRHILDCAQIHPLLPAGARGLVDMGSGAGLPGLVLAIMGVDNVHLIESDTRKAAFLGEAARHLELNITIHNSRIETMTPLAVQVVTARALQPLSTLLALASRVAPDAACYFHKGLSWRNELAAAGGLCHPAATIHQSLSDPAGVVIELPGIPAQNARES